MPEKIQYSFTTKEIKPSKSKFPPKMGKNPNIIKSNNKNDKKAMPAIDGNSNSQMISEFWKNYYNETEKFTKNPIAPINLTAPKPNEIVKQKVREAKQFSYAKKYAYENTPNKSTIFPKPNESMIKELPTQTNSKPNTSIKELTSPVNSKPNTSIKELPTQINAKPNTSIKESTAQINSKPNTSIKELTSQGNLKPNSTVDNVSDEKLSFKLSKVYDSTKTDFSKNNEITREITPKSNIPNIKQNKVENYNSSLSIKNPQKNQETNQYFSDLRQNFENKTNNKEQTQFNISPTSNNSTEELNQSFSPKLDIPRVSSANLFSDTIKPQSFTNFSQLKANSEPISTPNYPLLQMLPSPLNENKENSRSIEKMRDNIYISTFKSLPTQEKLKEPPPMQVQSQAANSGKSSSYGGGSSVVINNMATIDQTIMAAVMLPIWRQGFVG
jgi:hypothetical protein